MEKFKNLFRLNSVKKKFIFYILSIFILGVTRDHQKDHTLQGVFSSLSSELK